MTVAELIEQLKTMPQDWDVVVDVHADDCWEGATLGAAWEGDRVVRHVEGTAKLDGYLHVAINAMEYEASEKKGFRLLVSQDHPIDPDEDDAREQRSSYGPLQE